MKLPSSHPTDDQTFADLLATVIVQRPINHDRPFQVPEFFAQLEKLQGGSQGLQSFYEINGGQAALRDRVNLMCWRWVGLGLLVPTTNMQFFEMTPEGKSVLEGAVNEAAPLLSAGGTAGLLRDRIEGISERVLTAIDEAQQCLHGGQFQAATIMIGVGSESLVLELADALEARRSGLGLPKRSARTPLQTLDWLQTCFADHAKGIRPAISAVGADAHWVGELAVMLGPANAIRVSRNLVVHGGQFRATRADVWAFMIGFPTMAQAIVETTRALGDVAKD